MSTSVKLKRSGVQGKVPTTAQLELGEVAINTRDGKIFIKQSIPDGNTVIEEVKEFIANAPDESRFYVSADGGNDTDNDGKSWGRPLATIEAAITAVGSSTSTINLIQIGPGDYYSNGHIDVPDNTIIHCVHRTVFVRPNTGYESKNVFRLGSGCFIEGIEFEDWVLDDLDNPTEGFAISFRPGAIIRRAPYVHKIGMRKTPTWDTVAPPLDRDNANPLVGNGGGVVLADGLVCSPYSIYPNIMTWGATPVSQNGIGYCAKNGGLVNAVNAISIWAHKHFLALSGGQIILSSCATQFGDYTLVSSGTRNLVIPPDANTSLLVTDTTAASAIDAAANTIVDDTWDALVTNNYTTNWSSLDEQYTRRDARELIQVISWVLQSANEKPMQDFTKGIFDTQGFNILERTISSISGNGATTTVVTSEAHRLTSGDSIDILRTDDFTAGSYTVAGVTDDNTFTISSSFNGTETIGNNEAVIDTGRLAAFIFSWQFIRDEIKALTNVGASADALVDELINNILVETVNNTSNYLVSEPSTITAISHTWTAIMAGVALTKIPPARNFATIEESILELSNGLVIASGQDDQGSALFIGGMKIDADTGELSGPPFEQSVNRIATKAAIAGSF